MARDSRSVRRKRRLRRNVSLMTRALEQSQAGFQKAVTGLLFVLAQSGGEVSITKGTMEQVVAKIQTLGWWIDKGANENEFIVRLIDQDAVNPAQDAPGTPIASSVDPTPALVITHPDEAT